MNFHMNQTIDRLLKRIEFFLIYLYPLVLLTVVFTAWFATIYHWGHRPLPTVNDPYFFGGPLTLALHWPAHTHVIPLVSYFLPVAVFFTARKSIRLINHEKERELIFLAILWISTFILLIVHPAYAWLVD